MVVVDETLAMEKVKNFLDCRGDFVPRYLC
jgi:hypothetical protein